MTAENNKQPTLRQTARYQAMQTLEKSQTDHAFANKLVNEVLKTEKVSEADRNLYTTLVYGSLQYYYTLDALLRKMVDKPNKVSPWLWQLLVLSLYQFYYLENIPDHAIANEAVKITKKRGNFPLSKFVNGVLRKTMRKYPTIDDFIVKAATDWRTKTAYSYSLPLIWVDYFAKRFGQAETEKLAASLLVKPHLSVRLAADYVNEQAEIEKALFAAGFDSEASLIAPHTLRVTGGSVAETDLFTTGKITIQDESAILAVEALDPQPGELILDVCAAPGGKTIQIAERVGPTGKVWACDIAADKLPLIAAYAARMHVDKQVEVCQQDATALSERFTPATFDRILVDAPCSGIGLFRRKPDTKNNKVLQDLQSLQKIQLAILSQAIPLLKKGGIIVYSTCTITVEENAQVISALLEQFKELRLLPLEMWRDQLGSAVKADGSVEILPHQFGSDGFFIARLYKQ